MQWESATQEQPTIFGFRSGSAQFSFGLAPGTTSAEITYGEIGRFGYECRLGGRFVRGAVIVPDPDE